MNYFWNTYKRIINKFQYIRNYATSFIYNKMFNCSECFFKYPINYTRGEEYIKISKGGLFGKMAVITAWDEYEGYRFKPEVIIGENCNFGDFLHLTCINKITIGSNVLTGRWVTITDHGHGTAEEIINGVAPLKRRLYSKGRVVIEDNVWIGDKVTILPSVTIGKNSIIAANSVVTNDIPSNSVAAGNPARVIKSIYN